MKKLFYLYPSALVGLFFFHPVNYKSVHNLFTPLTTYYLDADGDGHGDAAHSVIGPFQLPGYVENADDCDDTNPAINPGALEVCNGLDDNCDGVIDPLSTWYLDSDGDGHNNTCISTVACAQPPGWVPDYGYYLDDYCDTDHNSLDPCGENVCDAIWYLDADGDGYPDLNTSVIAPYQPAGYLPSSPYNPIPVDCNDSDAAVHPGAQEISCNGIDDNCDGIVDPETCNEIDDDCDGEIDEGVQITWWVDTDFDGYVNICLPVVSCSPPPGFSYPFIPGADCDDSDPFTTCFTGGGCGSGSRDFCQSIWYADTDGDGFGDPATMLLAAYIPEGYVPPNCYPWYGSCFDCDDSDASIYPGAPEICNGIDDNCVGGIDEGAQTTFYADLDGDGYINWYVTLLACSAPPGWTSQVTDHDCDDSDPQIHVGCGEIEVCNGVDDNGNGLVDDDDPEIVGQPTWYADTDHDGYGDENVPLAACSSPEGYVANTDDCDDSDGAVHPGAQEICNGIDDDCDGLTDDEDDDITGQLQWYVDGDDDGYGTTESSVTSCNQPDGYVGNATDCDDGHGTVYPDATELADNLDNDCDGLIDEGLASLTIDAGDCEIVYLGYLPEACEILNAIAEGGVTPYTYLWSNGATSSSITVCPSSTTTYEVTVTDHNGLTAQDVVTVQVIDVRCGNNNNKVQVCHLNGQTLCIGSGAVADHLAHGDQLGVCGGADPCENESQSTVFHPSGVVATESNESQTVDREHGELISVTPNPANEVLYLRTNLMTGVLSIVDISGNVILKQNISGSQNSINTSKLENGIYYIRMGNRKEFLTKRFVIVH